MKNCLHYYYYCITRKQRRRNKKLKHVIIDEKLSKTCALSWHQRMHWIFMIRKLSATQTDKHWNWVDERCFAFICDFVFSLFHNPFNCRIYRRSDIHSVNRSRNMWCLKLYILGWLNKITCSSLGIDFSTRFISCHRWHGDCVVGRNSLHISVSMQWSGICNVPKV